MITQEEARIAKRALEEQLASHNSKPALGLVRDPRNPESWAIAIGFEKPPRHTVPKKFDGVRVIRTTIGPATRVR